MKMNLKRPITFIKVQTTGTNPFKDRIVEISFSKILSNGEEKSGNRLFNPEIEISEEITKINGITNEMVAGKSTFQEAASAIYEFLKDTDFAGFEIKNFDLKFLIEEFNRAGIPFVITNRNIIDLSVLYKKLNPRTLKSAVKEYLGHEIEETITSISSVKNYKNLMNAMLTKHEGQQIENTKILSCDISDLNSLLLGNKKTLDLRGVIALNEEGRPIFTLGKYTNQLVSESLLNDKKYYNWILNDSDFPADTKQIIKKIIESANKSADALKKV
jgi:DNA polymerase-3 subunit epsilon